MNGTLRINLGRRITIDDRYMHGRSCVGDTGDVHPHFFQTIGIYYAMSPHIFLFRFCIWRGFKNKNDVCHVLCEELFILDVTHSQVDFETEFGVVTLILIFL